MAYSNKVISNPKTGQEIRFLQTSKDTAGHLLEIEASFKPFSKEPPAHYHPAQSEDFKVLQGTLTVNLNGEFMELTKGSVLHIPANTPHAMWNGAGEKAVVNWKVQPALNTEYFLENVTGLANDGKTNKEGMPSLLQIAMLSKHFAPVFRLAKPSFVLQQIVFTMLIPFAYLAGYKTSYERYQD